jgi:hypothetical protein
MRISVQCVSNVSTTMTLEFRKLFCAYKFYEKMCVWFAKSHIMRLERT